MKIKFFFTLILAAHFSISLKSFAQSEPSRAPSVYTNGFTIVPKEWAILKCSKIGDLGVVVYFTSDMENCDYFNLEMHRFNATDDEMIAFKRFEPTSDEYKKKYQGKDSLKFKAICPETETSTSDFQVNTKKYIASEFVNDVFCTFKPKTLNSFYFIIKGYNKTGEKNRFGEDIFKTTDFTPKSISIRNWDDGHH